MPKRKKILSKDDWQRTRCFLDYGRLISIRNNLTKLTKEPEITPLESVQITNAINILHKLISSFNTTNSQALSYEYYLSQK